MEKIVLIGGGGHSKVIIDTIKSKNSFEIEGIVEKNKKGHILEIPIIGNDLMLSDIYKKGTDNAFICIGSIRNTKFRNDIFENVKNIGFKLPVLTHKNSCISAYSKIGQGTCVMSGSIVNADTDIGKNCIINTGAIVEHDCIVKDNVQISSGSVIAGGVTIEKDTFIGINSSVIEGICIGENVTVGAGSVVIKDIPSNCVVVGNPAKIIKYK